MKVWVVVERDGGVAIGIFSGQTAAYKYANELDDATEKSRGSYRVEEFEVRDS